MSFRFRVDKLFHKDAIAIWMMNYQREGVHVAKPITLEFGPAESGAFLLPEPTLELRTHDAFEMIQAMLDACAENDFIQRKTKSKGELEATLKHLEDIRKLNDRLMKMVEEKL